VTERRLPFRQGLVLIVVAGVLGVLTVLTACFVTLAHLERQASSRRTATLKALLLARSGLEDALARLDAGQDPALRRSAYAGEDADLSGILESVERAEEIHQPGVLNLQDCPLAHALRPSFAVDSGGTTANVQVDGRRRGYSGSLAPPRSGCYAMQVEDESGKLCVNGGFLDARDRDGDAIPDHRDRSIPGRGWNSQLLRVLGNLGSGLGLPTLGTDLIVGRPAGGYRSMAHVQAAAGTPVDLSPYLCLSVWTDLKVVRPNALGVNFLAPNDVKKHRGALILEEGGRPPVNLNAAPKPVLAALLKGLRGAVQFPVHHFISGIPPWGPRMYEVTPAQADAVADAILSARPFGTWSEFEAFLDSLVPSVLNGNFSRQDVIAPGDLGLADLIKANFNPNTMLDKQMPDQMSWRWMDKSDLFVWSTEGSLGPTGAARIRVVARVTDSSGRLQASRSLSTALKRFELLRQTSQKDFMGGRTPGAGGTSCLSLETPSPLTPRTACAGAAWNPSGLGLGAMTYPCPMSAVLAGNAADYDGCIALATVETAHTNPNGGTLTFLHHFDEDWDADYTLPLRDGARKAGPIGADGSLQTDCTRQVWPSASVEPNTLHPDGAFLQLGRSPSYSALNLPGDLDLTSDHGAISYWFKRNSWDNFIDTDFSCVRRAPGGGTQVLAIGVAKNPYDYMMGIYLESWATWRAPYTEEEARHAQGMRQEFVRYFPGDFTRPYMPDMRWRLLGAFYDDDQTSPGEDTYLKVLGATTLSTTARYLPFNPYDPATGEKLVQDPLAVFTLGGDGSVGDISNYEVQLVMDEFAVCDFGDDVGTSRPDFDAWIRDRFADGRYYKGNDGTFLSVVLTPFPKGSSRLLWASWTERLPSHPGLESRRADFGEPLVQPLYPRILDPRLAKARVEVDLLGPAGTLTGPALQVLDRPGGTWISRTLSSFTYRVRFLTSPVLNPLTGLPDETGQPVLETPFFDDITFAWQPSTGARIVSFDCGS